MKVRSKEKKNKIRLTFGGGGGASLKVMNEFVGCDFNAIVPRFHFDDSQNSIQNDGLLKILFIGKKKKTRPAPCKQLNQKIIKVN